MSDLQSFQDFMAQRREVGSAYVRGEAAPLGEIVTRNDPASFFGPGGGHVQGAETVWARYEKDAAMFGEKGESSFEILHTAASDGLAYFVGLQKATAYFGGRNEPANMTLRITEIYRYEDGGWKMIHRHADSLAEEKPGEK